MENKIGEGIYAEFGRMFSLVGCQATRLQFVIDGEAAERVFNILKESHFAKSHNALGFTTQIEFDYADGILRIEERTDANSLVEELLYFFVGYDNFYFLTEYSEDGVVQGYDTNDDEGKYFYNKKNTNYENLENN